MTQFKSIKNPNIKLPINAPPLPKVKDKAAAITLQITNKYAVHLISKCRSTTLTPLKLVKESNRKSKPVPGTFCRPLDLLLDFLLVPVTEKHRQIHVTFVCEVCFICKESMYWAKRRKFNQISIYSGAQLSLKPWFLIIVKSDLSCVAFLLEVWRRLN